jgi:transcriptional regulator with XRE-family HTH domain
LNKINPADQTPLDSATPEAAEPTAFARWLADAMPRHGYPLRDTDGPRAGGISQLAIDASLPMATISLLVNSKAEPSIDTLRKLGAVFGLSIGQMLIHAGLATPEEIAPQAVVAGAAPAEWRQLGDFLTTRRAQLNPDFRGRKVFADRTRINYRVLFDIEKGRRTNFGAATLASIEVAYELPPGTIDKILTGDDVDAVLATLPSASLDVSPAEPAAPCLSGVEHHREAQRLIAPGEYDEDIEQDLVARDTAVAQVHATLAVADAVRDLVKVLRGDSEETSR